MNWMKWMNKRPVELIRVLGIPVSQHVFSFYRPGSLYFTVQCQVYLSQGLVLFQVTNGRHLPYAWCTRVSYLGHPVSRRQLTKGTRQPGNCSRFSIRVQWNFKFRAQPRSQRKTWYGAVHLQKRTIHFLGGTPKTHSMWTESRDLNTMTMNHLVWWFFFCPWETVLNPLKKRGILWWFLCGLGQHNLP